MIQWFNFFGCVCVCASLCVGQVLRFLELTKRIRRLVQAWGYIASFTEHWASIYDDSLAIMLFIAIAIAFYKLTSLGSSQIIEVKNS